MNRWPLKVKFGLYAAALTTVAVSLSLLAMRPLIFRHQLAELDQQLTENAEELFRDVDNFTGAPKNFRKSAQAQFERLIPIGLRGRYIEVEGPDGTIYRSKNLRDTDLRAEGDGLQTVLIAGRNARIGTFTHGFLILHIGTRMGTIEAMQQDLQNAILVIVPAGAAVVFILGWLLGTRALKPLRVLTCAAEKIDIVRPEERLPVPAAHDEIFRLTEVLNRTFERLQNSYAAAARFSADASHQLKTPVAVLRASIDALRSGTLQGPEAQAELDDMLKQTRRLTTLVEDLLLLAQLDAGRLQLAPEQIDAAALAAAMADDVEVLCAARGLELELDLPASLPALGDHRRVAVILQNLGENAVKYASEHGRVRISAGEEADTVHVTVANTGPAIPEESRARLFERFHRGEVGENVRGHGLGLNIARSLARAQGGDVVLACSDGEWTAFSLRLPPAPATAISTQS